MVAHPDLLLLFFGTKSWVSLVYFLQLVPRGQHSATAVVCSEGRIEEPLYQRHTPNCSPTGRRWRQVQMRRLESCHARGSYAGDQRHAECQLWVVGFRSCTPRNRVNSYRFRTWFLNYYILNLFMARNESSSLNRRKFTTKLYSTSFKANKFLYLKNLARGKPNIFYGKPDQLVFRFSFFILAISFVIKVWQLRYGNTCCCRMINVTKKPSRWHETHKVSATQNYSPKIPHTWPLDC